jgi:hypothetical protein
MGPRAGLDDVKKRKIMLLPVLELRSFDVHPLASRYTDCLIPTPSMRGSKEK